MECTLDGGWNGEECYTLKCKIFKARKEHRCGECNRIIAKGESYEGYNGVHDGYFFWEKTCIDCVSIRESFYPFGGYMFGNILDTVGEHIIYELHGEVDEKCIVPLTPKARSRVFELMEKGWCDD